MAPRAGFEPATIRLTVSNYFISPRCMAFHEHREVPYFIDFLRRLLSVAFHRGTKLCRFMWPPSGPEMPKTDHRKNLTPTLITGLKPAPEGQRYQVMDAQVPGLGVRVTDRGHKTFILRTRYPGRPNPTRREIGNCADISLTDAREKARKWRAMVVQGLDPAIEEERERQEALRKLATTFNVVAEDFIREKLPGERKGKEIERDIRRDLLPRWKDKPIAAITDLDVLAVIKAKMPNGKVGARNLLALIRRLFRWAIAQRTYGLAHSPCEGLQASAVLGEVKGSRDRIHSDDEIFAFWRAAGRMPKPYGAVYQGLMLTALRLNEMADASRSEFNHRDRVWVIPAGRMKGRNAGKKQARTHAVPLTEDFLTVLEGLPKLNGGPYLFSTTNGEKPIWMGTKVKQQLDRRMLRTLRALARVRGEDTRTVKLPHFVNHDIRRTVRSRLSRLKVAEEAREAVLAHARPGIKGVYDVYDYLDEKREALELWAARLREIVAPPQDNVIKFVAVA
jgi:integrase